MPELPSAFTNAISGKYSVEREIGAGGMANVYLARDVRHNRNVAIKVLKPELAASLGAERFLKEIEIAARLTHPHIIPLHDSGEAEGFLYYVMPFIEGESLRSRLNRVRRFDKASALKIAENVGDALSYAHGEGILHRDIKPENILFAQGHPMVADFGIARAVSTAGGANITRTGLAVGTPGYMSPEQAVGARDIDARTDIYSLACVLYEMLVGELPGMWQMEESLRIGAFADPPDGHREFIRAFGKQTEHALVRALSLQKRDRFPTVAAFVEALQGKEIAPIRRFSDSEVKEIVRQAADDQVATTPSGGMSLKTVQQIAEDVGIPPEKIEQAAGKLAKRQSTAPPSKSGPGAFWLGNSTLLESERVIEGEVSPAIYEEIEEEVQATFSTGGEVDVLGKSLHWRTKNPELGKTRALQVRVTSRGGKTLVQVQERIGELATALYCSILVGGGVGGIGTILGIGLGWLGHGMASGLMSIGWAGGTYALTRAIYKAIARKKHSDLEALTNRIEEIAEDSIEIQIQSDQAVRTLPT